MSDIGMGLKLHVLIFLSQFLCSFGLHKLQFLDFYKRSNVRGREEYVSQSHYSRDSWSCISLCINTQDCITASFNQESNSCWLSERSTVDDDPMGYIAEHAERLDGWKLFSRLRYRVVSVTGPHGRYTMTFTDAVAECLSRGMVIASRSELLEARSQGYYMCSCGWLSDGSQGFVMQTHESWCYYYFTTDIHYCSQTIANVYCKR